MATIPFWDAIDAEALYDLLEREVIPEFYTRDDQGIPSAWVARMRESMARLTPRFSTNRADVANTSSDTTSRRPHPTVSGLATKAQSACR